MYKVRTQHLESLKKQLQANNKHLAKHTPSPITKKLIKANEKQIKLLEDEYYIN